MKTPILLVIGALLVTSCVTEKMLPNNNLNSNATDVGQNTSIEVAFNELLAQIDTLVVGSRGVPEQSSFEWSEKDNAQNRVEVHGMKVLYAESTEVANTLPGVLEQLGFDQNYTAEGTTVGSVGLQRGDLGCVVRVINAGARERNEQNIEYTFEDISDREYESTLMCAYVN